MKPKSFETGNNEVVEALKDWAVDVYYPYLFHRGGAALGIGIR